MYFLDTGLCEYITGWSRAVVERGAISSVPEVWCLARNLLHQIYYLRFTKSPSMDSSSIFRNLRSAM